MTRAEEDGRGGEGGEGAPPEPPARARVHARVRGRVQGVGFRYTTQEEARRLGLAGWVRNLPDGSVEAAAEGPRAALERFVAFLHQGPRLARVVNVDVTWEPPTGEHGAFVVRG